MVEDTLPSPQVVYLDFDGAQDADYNGPIHFPDVDVPAFSLDAFGLLEHEQEVIELAVARLDALFADFASPAHPDAPTPIQFVTERPESGPYSTVYIGGAGDEFAAHGRFFGLAEQVDVGDQDLRDEAFVFPENFAGTGHTADEVALALANIIAHEVGHLLGYAHVDEPTSVMANLDGRSLWDGGLSFGAAAGADGHPTAVGQGSSVGLGPVANGPEYDWGDAPDPMYPALAVNGGASHVITPGFFLGSTVDAVADGQPDVMSVGDDNNGIPNDEDGVTAWLNVSPGFMASVDVTASAPGYLDAWIDFNGDGSWADAGDQIFAGTPLMGGVNTLNFLIPYSASPGITTFSRFRFSSTGELSYTGPASDGEVEDHEVFMEYPYMSSQFDWGDAPDPTYPTLASSNGANHIIAGPWLGALEDVPDPESDGLPHPAALGDNADGANDENGVIIPPLVQGQAVNVTVEVNGGGGIVEAWVDFDRDGVWQHPTEQVFAAYLPDGVHQIPVTAPWDSVVGPTFARFRISTYGGLAPDGPASDGEVEDYAVTIRDITGPRVVSLWPVPGTVAPFVPSVSVAFDELLDQRTVDTSTFRLSDLGPDHQWGTGDDTLIPGDVIWDFQSLRAVFQPWAVLPDGEYGVWLDGTASITDLAGNRLDGEFSGAFPSGDGAPGGDFLAFFTIADMAPAGWWEVGNRSARGGGISQNDGDPSAPALTLAQDNNPVAAWHDDSSGDTEIYVRRWDGATWAEMGVNSATGGGISDNAGWSEYPSLARGLGAIPSWHGRTRTARTPMRKST